MSEAPPSENTPAPLEKPLSGAAKLALIASAAGTIALFYLFICVTIVALVIWLGLVFLTVLALARFGLSGLIIRYAERDTKLLLLLIKSLWLSQGAKFRLALKPEEAPGIMAILQRLCARLEIPLPNSVYLEMNAGAWVELRGLRQNLGRTNIGIGYDLLAGLTEQEIEAVLAHELAHAKLIQRAFKNWLGSGLARAGRIIQGLSGMAHAHRQAKDFFATVELILRVADRLTLWCARLVSAYSRQDEFEADRGAAELVGSAPLRSSLQRLDRLHLLLDRLPWNERRAQIKSEEGLSRWLVRELAAVAELAPADETAPLAYNPYSTHPATSDRLAALPADGSTLHDSPNGLGLLAQPDKVALQLVIEIERTLLVAERADRRELRRWLRKVRRHTHVRPLQWPGVVMMLAGLIIGFVGFAAMPWYGAIPLIVAIVALGWGLFRAADYRDGETLPRPDFAVLKKAWSKRDEAKDIEALQKQIEKELQKAVAAEKKKKRMVAILVREAYASLARCDYLRAHVAARLGRDLAPKSVESLLALAIASAALHQEDQAHAVLKAIQRLSSFRSPSTQWGGAWALTLLGAWMPAEAMLSEALKKQPDDPTLLALLAFNQSRRGKLLSALENLRKTCQPVQAGVEYTKMLVSLLLDQGDLPEAEHWLTQLEQTSADDREVQFSWVRRHLLQRQFPEAELRIRRMETPGIPGDYLLAFGHQYESARDDRQAAIFFSRSLGKGHYPEAHLGLARLALQTRDKPKARAHILASLDTTKLLGENASTPHQVFHSALSQLLSLEQPTPGCRAWIAGFLPGSSAGSLKHRSLMIYSHTEKEAESHLQTIMQALEPNKPPLAPSCFLLTPAPQDNQPVQPVRPGVQHIYQ